MRNRPCVDNHMVSRLDVIYHDHQRIAEGGVKMFTTTERKPCANFLQMSAKCGSYFYQYPRNDFSKGGQ